MTSEKRIHALILAMGVTCVGGLIFLFGFLPYSYSHLTHMTSVVGALWTMWWLFPDFLHGMFVPPLCVLVVYLHRKQLAQLPVEGWGPGVLLVIASFAFFWTGHRVDNQYVGYYSFQILLASLVLWLLGWRWLKALAFPLAFLVFTWPAPFLDSIVTFPLRLFMSAISVSTLNLFGIASVQNGTGIISAQNLLLPDAIGASGKLFSLDVADPCSGIHSLFALMMISALYGHFVLQTPWKRMLLFVLSVPLAIVGNLVRILILTFGIITLGAPTAIGDLAHPTWIHEGAGYVVFIVALGGMLLIAHILNSSVSSWRERWDSKFEKDRPTSSALKPDQETIVDIY